MGVWINMREVCMDNEWEDAILAIFAGAFSRWSNNGAGG